ncbi:hypothetical protein HK099_004240 [Clydaea vesicula]|uniref:EF-hand domain-containing protein n=1 Tax=Clydaea vesicula TaxID=447962 RepID=A0AAD5Y0D1_9FUNG|nr:hypothetical protein HK099_004240 [Clydaea vesicula]
MAFQAFTLFDKDGNGSIDYEELKEIFISLNEESSESELQLMINNIDFNKTGKVDFDEFIAVMETTKKNRKQQQNNSISQFHFQKLSGDENSIDTQSNEALVEAFRAMDADGNGMISPADLRSVLKGLSQDASAEKVCHFYYV